MAYYNPEPVRPQPQSLKVSKSYATQGYPRPSRRPKPQAKPRKRSGSRSGSFVFFGGGMLALAAMLITPKPGRLHSDAQGDVCQKQIQAQSVLSRDELTKLLTIPERSPKARVREVIAEPFCLLAPGSYREGVQAEREAYPLEFDPHTWLVLLYEESEYAGYDFSFRQKN